MDPTYSPFEQSPPTRLYNTRVMRLAIAFIVVVGLIFVGWQIYLSTTLHVVKTDPGLGNVSYISPYVKIYFNEPLVKDDLSIQTDSNILSYTLSDKVVTVLLYQKLTVGKSYDIVIKNAVSTSGKKLINKHLTFTAKNIGFDSLSKEQQAATISVQDQYPYSVTTIDYTGFDALTDHGISQNQIDKLKSNLFSFSAQTGKNYKAMAIDTSSIVLTPHDPDSTNPNNLATFNIKLDSTQFKVSLSYSGLSAAIIQIFDASGSLVYDSNAAHD